MVNLCRLENRLRKSLSSPQPEGRARLAGLISGNTRWKGRAPEE